MPKSEFRCPPPPHFEERASPTTVTMRAITDGAEEEQEQLQVESLPSEPFEVVFDRAVEAYLSADLDSALELFRDALRIDPEHEVCKHNIRRIEKRLDQA